MYKSWMWKQRSYREQFQDDQAAGGAGGSVVVDESEHEGQQADDESSTEQQADGEADPQAAEEVVFGFGDEPVAKSEEEELELSPVANTAWAKMRKEKQDLVKRVRELEAERSTQQAATPKAEAVGERPTLESCEFDGEAYGEKLLAWTERKARAEQKAAAEQQEQQAAQATWTKKLTDYRAAGAALKVSGFEDAEAVVTSVLSPVQQQILVQGPKSAQASAQLVAALGRNPAKLKELAAIKDNVQYTFAVAELVGQLKVTPKNVPPAPERQVRGTAGGASGVDNTLAKLEADADRTGDRSKVIAYKREQRNKAAA